MNNYKGKKGYVTFLGIYLTVVIIALIFYFISNVYLKKFSSYKKQGEHLPAQEQDNVNKKPIADEAKRKMDELDRQLSNSIRKMDDFNR